MSAALAVASAPPAERIADAAAPRASHRCIHGQLRASAPPLTTPQLYASPAATADTLFSDESGAAALGGPPMEKAAHAAPPIHDESSRASEFAPLRIVVDTHHLDADPDACFREGDALGNVGHHRRCGAEEVITAEKVTLLRERILPEAAAALSRLLRVRRVSQPLAVRSLRCGFAGGAVVGDAYRQHGVADADIVVFVTARPIASGGASPLSAGDTIAFAGHCEVDQHGRPTAAHFNWSPAHLSEPPSRFFFEYLLRVAMHELTHALVFSPGLLDSFAGGPATNFVPTPYGGYARAVASPAVRNTVRQHFSCGDLEGAQLEDGGGAGTGGSHWEMRLFRGEYMTGSASPGRRVVSGLTLALFADSGWYRVDAAAAEPLSWGAGGGCAFVRRKCSEWTQPRYLCRTPGEPGCSYDRRAEAYCAVVQHPHKVPEQMRYLDQPDAGGYSPLLDFCPVYRAYANGDCTDDAAATGSGQERCKACRCFERKAWFGMQTTSCHRSRCLNATTLELRLNGQWHRCPSAGGDIPVASNVHEDQLAYLSHSVHCPPAVEMCTFDDGLWPQLHAIEPDGGSSTSGLTVTLRGENLELLQPPLRLALALRSVELLATNLTLAQDGSVVAVLPAFPPSTSFARADIFLSDANGRTALLFAAFTYNPGPQPYLVTAIILAGLSLCGFVLIPLYVHRGCAQDLRDDRGPRSLV